LEIYGRHLTNILDGLNNLREHPWYGVNNFGLDFAGQQELRTKLPRLSEDAHSLQAAVTALKEATGLEIELAVSAIARVAGLREDLPKCSDATPEELLQSLVKAADRDCARSFSAEVTAWWQEARALEAHFSKTSDVEPDRFAHVISVCKQAEEWGFGSRTIRELRAKMTAAEAFAGRIERTLPFFAEAVRTLGCDVAYEIPALCDLAITIRLAEQTPSELLAMRQASFEQENVSVLVRQAEQEAERLRAERGRLSNSFELNSTLSDEELNRHVAALAGCGKSPKMVDYSVTLA
jgi:hypothetical protein